MFRSFGSGSIPVTYGPADFDGDDVPLGMISVEGARERLDPLKRFN